MFKKPLLITIVLLSMFLPAGACAQEGIVNLNLSGYPVDGRSLQYFIFDVILDRLDPVSCRLIDVDLSGMPSKIKPGKSFFIDVPIKFASGSGTVKNEHVYMVARNLGVERGGDSRLLVSNDPEEIGSEGSLLKEQLSRALPVRILYYHKAAAGKRFRLKLLVTNRNAYPVDILVSKGLGGPCIDGIYAGHLATTRFMRQERVDAGRILKIPARSFLVLSDQEIKEAEISTGIIKLRQLSGDGAVIDLIVVKDGKKPNPNAPPLSFKEDGRISGALSQGQIDLARSFSFGQKPLDIRIGEGPALIPESGGFDIHLGNYGILHRIGLTLTNSSNKKKTASLFYVATGGPARGVFIINGSLYETGLLDPKGTKSEKLISISVPAKSSRSVSVNMMPEPGSFYPTRLVLLEERP